MECELFGVCFCCVWQLKLKLTYIMYLYLSSIILHPIKFQQTLWNSYGIMEKFIYGHMESGLCESYIAACSPPSNYIQRISTVWNTSKTRLQVNIYFWGVQFLLLNRVMVHVIEHGEFGLACWLGFFWWAECCCRVPIYDLGAILDRPCAWHNHSSYQH